MAILPKQDRSRNTNSDGDESEQTVGPPPIEFGIHCRTEKRKAETGQSSDEGRSSAGRGGVSRICIDDVGLRTLETDNQAGGEDDSPNVGSYPMGFVLSGPPVDEEANGYGESTRKHKGHAIFWSSTVTISFLQRTVYLCESLGLVSVLTKDRVCSSGRRREKRRL
jgi:hypothetical protein